MKKTILMGAMVASMMMVGCGSDNSDSVKSNVNNTGMDSNMSNTMDSNTTGSGMDNNISTERFTKMTMMGDTVEIDNETKLEWIGSAGNSACKPNGAATTEEADIVTAKTHCDALEFAGHDDWRAGTAEENAKFIKDMKAAGMTPFYGNPACPRLIGVDGDKAQAVNTHNSSPVGSLTAWATLITQGASNHGIKCVRNR